MCLKWFLPTPPDAPALPPAKKADPIIKPIAKTKKLISPEDISKVKYGEKRTKEGAPERKRVTADALKINLGAGDASSQTGGLNV